MLNQPVRGSSLSWFGMFAIVALGATPCAVSGCSSDSGKAPGFGGAGGMPSTGGSAGTATSTAGSATSAAGGVAGAVSAAGGSATGGSTGALGGSAGSGVAGSVGMGGSVGTAGNVGVGGSANAGSGGTATGADCSKLPLCDSFEDTAVGSPPKSSLWTLVPSAASGSSTIDSIGAHGSMHSLKVVSPDRRYLRNTSVIGTLGSVVHVRFYLRLDSALAEGHGGMIVTHPTMVDQYSQQNELRFGSQGQVFHWNTDSDGANIPDVSPTGNAASVKPTTNTWYCVELTINTNGHLNASIDGVDVPGLTEDGTATPNIDQAWVGSAPSLARYTAMADFSFGWQSYGGGALTLWYDDVALSSSPIGCL
ncbi:MAG TPA: hypothetical protein VER96_04860 [Polyangiaceae bacterium]|nr:hypothetical protein [Polyangiaceae bacterium]